MSKARSRVERSLTRAARAALSANSACWNGADARAAHQLEARRVQSARTSAENENCCSRPLLSFLCTNNARQTTGARWATHCAGEWIRSWGIQSSVVGGCVKKDCSCHPAECFALHTALAVTRSPPNYIADTLCFDFTSQQIQFDLNAEDSGAWKVTRTHSVYDAAFSTLPLFLTHSLVSTSFTFFFEFNLFSHFYYQCLFCTLKIPLFGDQFTYIDCEPL